MSADEIKPPPANLTDAERDEAKRLLIATRAKAAKPGRAEDLLAELRRIAALRGTPPMSADDQRAVTSIWLSAFFENRFFFSVDQLRRAFVDTTAEVTFDPKPADVLHRLQKTIQVDHRQINLLEWLTEHGADDWRTRAGQVRPPYPWEVQPEKWKPPTDAERAAVAARARDVIRALGGTEPPPATPHSQAPIDTPQTKDAFAGLEPDDEGPGLFGDDEGIPEWEPGV